MAERVTHLVARRGAVTKKRIVRHAGSVLGIQTIATCVPCRGMSTCRLNEHRWNESFWPSRIKVHSAYTWMKMLRKVNRKCGFTIFARFTGTFIDVHSTRGAIPPTVARARDILGVELIFA